MLKPDIPDFASWDGNRTPRDRRQHPIPSNLASESRLATVNHPDHLALGRAQLQAFGEKYSPVVSSDFEFQVPKGLNLIFFTLAHVALHILFQALRHHAQSFTPTTDLNLSSPSGLSTPSSISVHLPSEQPELPQGHDEVILQDTPPYNPSMRAPEASSSQTVNSENNPRIINGPSNSIIPAKDHTEVIDLTLSDEDVEESLPVTTRDTPLSDRMEPLFTPPPTNRRARVLMDHVAVPSLPKGTTKAEYKPMSASPGPSLGPPRDTSRVSICDAPEITSTKNNVSTSGKGKGKEHIELPVSVSSVSVSRKKRNRVPAFLGEGIDTRGSAIIDAFCTHTLLPLTDPDTESLPHWKAMITDARFTFTRQFDKHMPPLSPDPVGLAMKHHLQLQEGALVGSQDVSAHITSVDSDCMLLQEHPAWELTPPCVSPKIIPGDKHRLIEQTPRASNSTSYHSDALESCPSKPSMPPLGSLDHPPVVGSTVSDKGVTFGIDEDVDLNLYFNGLGDSPNKQLPPCEDHSVRSPFQGPLHFNEQLMGLSSFGGDGFLGMPPSPNCGDSGQLPASGSPSTLLTEHDANQDTPPNFHDSHSSSQWTLGNDIDSPRLGDAMISQGPGTIDPSLLRGEQTAPSRESTSSRKHQPRSSLPEPIVYVRRPQDMSGMRGGKKPVRIKFREQESPEDTGHIEGVPVVVPPNSITKVQSHSDGTQEDDPDWLPSGSRAPSASKRNMKPPVSGTRISTVESHLESSYLPSATADIPTISLQSSGDKPRIRLKGPRRPEGTTDDITNSAGKTFCHHCRNTTDRPKMRCSNNVGGGQACGKRFCQRCIERRFLCPYCTNTCNCSTCSRKRGEDYVSMRTGSFTGPRIQRSITVVRNTPSAASAPNFWAHVYGLEGQHLGIAYVNEAAPVPKSSEKRPPRVFIGRPLESWKVRSVRDLEAIPDKVMTFIENSEKQGKGKSKAIGPPLRLFIGNRAALYEPFRPMTSGPSPMSSRSSSPGLGSEDTLLRIPEMERFWPQPDVGESCFWEPPPLLGLERGLSLPLSDDQVARAIQVALAALS
ncbi:hypothetical protein EDC04DRAFT_3141465 [Pisolithus marmoratus]|nr:hypothetical protein EDC04DRAFT_3141465 [Pisolithus marmoratus]